MVPANAFYRGVCVQSHRLAQAETFNIGGTEPCPQTFGRGFEQCLQSERVRLNRSVGKANEQQLSIT